ncbi:MAG: TRAP transporter small permease [Burkholderiales bacterium]|nr:TRAP transporter small permease [Burkholderiales bacterium]
MLDTALRWAERCSLAGVWFGGGLIFAAALLVSVDVTLRKLFAVTLGGADELSGYAFAIGTSWAFAFALIKRANVRVDALYQHLPARLRGLLDVLALLALGVLVAYLTWYAWNVLATSWHLKAQSNSALKTPLWIPQGLWFMGLVLFLTTLALLLARGLAAMMRGDWSTLHALLSARSIAEDAEDESAYAREAERAGGQANGHGAAR